MEEEIRRLKIKLQKSIEKMEGDHIQELITQKELNNIMDEYDGRKLKLEPLRRRSTRRPARLTEMYRG